MTTCKITVPYRHRSPVIHRIVRIHHQTGSAAQGDISRECWIRSARLSVDRRLQSGNVGDRMVVTALSGICAVPMLAIFVFTHPVSALVLIAFFLLDTVMGVLKQNKIH
ncbi:MAG: hypothetical protein JW768_16085 [Chitinispirillaceae bacterium]|nr:hypothetical protein [Chitinispirillaceae bacterium]